MSRRRAVPGRGPAAPGRPSPVPPPARRCPPAGAEGGTARAGCGGSPAQPPHRPQPRRAPGPRSPAHLSRSEPPAPRSCGRSCREPWQASAGTREAESWASFPRRLRGGMDGLGAPRFSRRDAGGWSPPAAGEQRLRLGCARFRCRPAEPGAGSDIKQQLTRADTPGASIPRRRRWEGRRVRSGADTGAGQCPFASPPRGDGWDLRPAGHSQPAVPGVRRRIGFFAF